MQVLGLLHCWRSLWGIQGPRIATTLTSVSCDYGFHSLTDWGGLHSSTPTFVFFVSDCSIPCLPVAVWNLAVPFDHSGQPFSSGELLNADSIPQLLAPVRAVSVFACFDKPSANHQTATPDLAPGGGRGAGRKGLAGDQRVCGTSRPDVRGTGSRRSGDHLNVRHPISVVLGKRAGHLESVGGYLLNRRSGIGWIHPSQNHSGGRGR